MRDKVEIGSYRDVVEDGTYVEVYRNLNKGRKNGEVWYSIRDVKTRRVIGHAQSVFLDNPEFRVNENGRQRVLREKRKNVHAVVRGTIRRALARYDEWVCQRECVRFSYNPYKLGSFYTEISPAAKMVNPIKTGEYALFSGRNTWVNNPS